MRISYDALFQAILTIEAGEAKRVELEGCTVYKVPSNNPDKYTIRVDIKSGREYKC